MSYTLPVVCWSDRDDARLAHDDLLSMTEHELFRERVQVTLALANWDKRDEPGIAWLMERLQRVRAEEQRRNNPRSGDARPGRAIGRFEDHGRCHPHRIR